MLLKIPALSSVYAADMERKPDVTELRLVVTAPDYGEARTAAGLQLTLSSNLPGETAADA